MKKLHIAFASILVCTAFSAGAKPESKYLKSDYSYHDDPIHPTMVQVYKTRGQAVATAAHPETVAKLVASRDALRRLLASVRPGYATDAVAATQIAAVSRYVTEETASWWCFWADDRTAARRLWVDTLLDFAAASRDEYCTCFYLDQLRWCAEEGDIPAILAIGDNADSSAVRTQSRMTARQLGWGACGK